jgi:hypothetical protein
VIPEPVLDAAKHTLRIAEPTLATLVAHAADPVHASLEGPEAERQLALLHAAGVIRGGRSHPAIREALKAIVRPELCTLELRADDRVVQGWVGYGSAALLRAPEADGTRRLLQLHPTLLPEALARLVDLGPRPRQEDDTRVPFDEHAFSAVRRRWRLTAGWTLDDGAAGTAELDVLDTDGGLWVLERAEDGERTALPATATFVWRHLVRLLMRRPAA